MAEKRECQVVYSEELAREICERIAEGGKLGEICAAADIPSRQTVYRWFLRYPEFAQMYGRARQLRALHRADQIDGLIASVIAGELDPNAARVAIQALQWQAAREDPKGFAEQSTTNMNLSATPAPASESESDSLAWLRGLLGKSENAKLTGPLPH
jgi:hypothetical protein